MADMLLFRRKMDRLIISCNNKGCIEFVDEKVHLTGEAASARVAKLEDLGVSEGYTIKVNEEKGKHGTCNHHIFMRSSPGLS